MSQEQNSSDPEVQAYLDEIRNEKTQEPSALRKSVVWNVRNTAIGKRVFGWNKGEDGTGYNYQATRYGERYEKERALQAPIAGTKAGDLDAGAVRLANPSGESLIRERLRKER